MEIDDSNRSEIGKRLMEEMRNRPGGSGSIPLLDDELERLDREIEERRNTADS